MDVTQHLPVQAERLAELGLDDAIRIQDRLEVDPDAWRACFPELAAIDPEPAGAAVALAGQGVHEAEDHLRGVRCCADAERWMQAI